MGEGDNEPHRDDGWEAAFKSDYLPTREWNPTMPRATYREQVAQALASPEAHHFLVRFAYTLTIFSRGASDAVPTADRAEYLASFNELLGVVLEQADATRYGPVSDQESLAKTIHAFRPHGVEEFRVESVIEVTFQTSGFTCAYCGDWDGKLPSRPGECRRCGRPKHSNEAMAMDTLRIADVESSSELGELDERPVGDAVRTLFDRRDLERCIVVSAGEDPDGDHWIHLLHRDDHILHTVVRRADETISILHSAVLGADERRESDTFLARYDARHAARLE